MVLGANKSKNKKNGNRGGRDYNVDIKKLDSVTKRMEMLHQEQEIARVTNRFISPSSISTDPADRDRERPHTVIRLNRNF